MKRCNQSSVTSVSMCDEPQPPLVKRARLSAPVINPITRRCNAFISQAGIHLDDLDDAILVHVFRHLTPLPDLFNVALVCRRFQRLKNNERLKLVVSQSQDLLRLGLPNTFPTLTAAVSASRPGDTIMMQPSVDHHRVQNVAVKWPLQILGGGDTLCQTRLLCPGGESDSGVDCWAACRVANLSILAQPLASCIALHHGTLLVEQCSLLNEEHPLKHLCSPISISPFADSYRRKLSVVETRIEGGAKALQCQNVKESLQDVRVIYSSTSGCLFWFEVS